MYKVLLTRTAEKSYCYLYKSNKPIFERVRKAIISLSKDPRQGKPLKLTLKGIWSYRVGMYRILYSIKDEVLTVYVLDIGHRREIYR